MTTAPEILPPAVDVPARGPSSGSSDDFTAFLLQLCSETLERQDIESLEYRAEIRRLNELREAAIEWAQIETWIDAHKESAADAAILPEYRARRASLLIAVHELRRKNP